MRLKNTAIKKVSKILCVVAAFLSLNCAPPKIAQNVPQKATEPAIKLLRVETSQYSQLKTRVLLRDEGNNPLVNLAPPFGNLNDWQATWKPGIESHPLLGVDSLLDFKIIEFQPKMVHQTSAPQETFVQLVIDISGSMTGEPLQKVKQAALEFIDLNNCKIALLAFNDAIHMKSDFTLDKVFLKSEVTSLSSGGGTHLYDALYYAIKNIKDKAGERYIIALTDGATSGDNYSLEQIINFANSGDVNISAQTGNHTKIFTLGLTYGGEELENLAHGTGGNFYYVKTPSSLTAAFVDLSETLLTKFYYLVSYKTPFPVEDATERKFTMKFKNMKLTKNYKAPLSRLRFQLSGTVFDEVTSERIPGAKLSIRPQDSDSIFTTQADTLGRYQLLVKRSSGKYSAFVEEKNHMIAVLDCFLDIRGKYYVEKDFTLKPLKKHATAVMRTIHFENNEYLFEPISFPDLIIMGNYLLKHLELKFEIAGHTDSYGSDDYNRWLSERRAESVRDFFISLGIPEENMTLKGYGEGRPIALNDTAENRYLNRRVEIKILEVVK